ncbi:hypothetical protein [Comamonas testosteroni]|uniref:hypothetical protein n=1 Tax=Comamonas testosteroni TaxID=285 RepID=UPI0006B8E10C|nr:hypothetical protein [Comamonas testosteroni]
MKNWKVYKGGALALLLAFSGYCEVANADTETVFIAKTPTEFSEGFNRAAQVYRLKPRMPQWPAKNGKFNATVAPGITVQAVGVSQGDGLSSVKVTCRVEPQCSESIFAAALGIDSEVNMDALKRYMQQVTREGLENSAISQAGLDYYLVADKAKKTLIFTITPEEDEDE